ncbi:peptidylprolyl isomerase [soil metagenome]
MPTSKQRRIAAQRHLQRQLERRAELAKKRRQRNIVLAAALSVLVVLGAVFLLTTTLGGDDEDPAAATPTDTEPTEDPEPVVPGECEFIPRPADGNPGVVDVGLPETPAPTEGTVDLAVATDQGDMVFSLDRASAPCAVQSFEHLASQDFFADSPCHRLTNADSFGVLQCGDPSGTGSGGPAYGFDAEPPAAENPYPTGTIAMANSGAPGTTGSQFFIMFTDTALPPEYSVVGTVSSGLEVVQTVAEAGNDGSLEATIGGGAPNLPITIESVSPVV